MSRLRLLVFTFGVVAVWGCADSPTAPPLRQPKVAKDCSTQIYSDPDNCSDFGSGGYSYSDYYGPGFAEVVITFGGSSPAGPGVPVLCPAFFKAFVPATLFPPGQPSLTVMSSGQFVPQSPNFIKGKATYDWPAGWWPDIAGSGREANITSAEAVCFVAMNSTGVYALKVDFYNFIATIRQGSPGSSGGGGGGGGSPTDHCQQEFITLEVDTGAGWQTVWQGYASICA